MIDNNKVDGLSLTVETVKDGNEEWFTVANEKEQRQTEG